MAKAKPAKSTAPRNTSKPAGARTKRQSAPKVDNQSRQPATRPAGARKAAAQAVIEPVAFPIVGIGASAGGLEALTALLANLPGQTGLAYVVVQHLDPHHSSMLTDLLAKGTTLPVQEVTDGVLVQPDHVYVIPPNMDMGLLHGRLQLIPRTETRHQQMPIDYFFRSLAEDQHANAIGVILSGTGTDGTLGLRAIKAQGGLTFAQNEATAKYSGMPHSAAAAGVVDAVLPPKGIADELARLQSHPHVALTPTDTADITLGGEDDLSKIFLLLRTATSVDFSYYKPTTIKRRIARRMVLHKIANLSHYRRYLKDNPPEIEALFQDLLINVTGFFREPDLFAVLKKRVFPRLTKDRATQLPLRIWVPGCSTGEEAYSLAISLLEFMRETGVSYPIQILATDVSEGAIETARVGLYLENIAQDVSPDRLRSFFVRANGGYQISKAVRDLCIFARQDVTRDPPFSKIDLISCRNLLIYLNQPMQRKIIATFHYALRANGILALGSSETIGTAAELFSLSDKKHKIYTKKSAVSQINFDLREPAILKLDANKRAIETSSGFDLPREVDRLLLTKYAPAGVLINDSLDILQFRGHTGNYLEPASGVPSINLLKMAREDLRLELRGAIQEAKKHNTTVHRRRVRVRSNSHTRLVDLNVIPILQPGLKERYFLILFEETSTVRQSEDATDKPAPARGRPGSAQRQLAQVQQELAVTKEYLQSTIEQLETTNEELRSALEEIQSSNEELQSTNEELETAKEELQSTNEELTTVNEEMQNRNQELTGLNNDLVNLISSTNIPIVILGSDLRIRRFTPMAEKVLSLISTDIGRPIGDLRLNVVVPDLERIAVDVIDRLEARELEMQDHAGHWYSIRLRPYKTLDHKIDGVLIAWVDIDALKHGRAQIQAGRDYAAALIETVFNPMLILDGNFCLRTANHVFYETFQFQPEQAAGKSIHELGDGRWNVNQLREALTAGLPATGRYERFELTAQRDGVVQTFTVNARRAYVDDPATPVIVIVMQAVARE